MATMSSTDDKPGTMDRARLRTRRLEAFSDGVFAIAVTLLVLDIVAPAGSAADPLAAIGGEWPSYLAFVVSFSTIGALWLGHSLVTEYVNRADPVFVRLNLLLLLVVSFLPFPTRLLAEYITKPRAERVATTVYGLTLLVAVGLLSALWRYALREQLVRPEAEDDELEELTQRLTPGLAGYLALLALGLFLPLLAVLGYLLIALYFLVPLGQSRRHKPIQ